MYWCKKCEKFVESSTWEGERKCEVCGSTELEEAKECWCCGEPSLKKYCDWCWDEATSVVRFFVKNKENPRHWLDLVSDASTAVWYEELGKERVQLRRAQNE